MRFLAPTFSLVLSAALAAAQTQTLPASPIINTPSSLQECSKTLLTWTPGTSGPFEIIVFRAADNTIAENLGSDINGTSFSWLVKEPANTEVYLQIKDTQFGGTGLSGKVTVGVGNTDCLTASSGASAPTASGNTPAVSDSITATAPAASNPGPTPAPTTAGGNTGTSKPQSSSPAKTSSGAASAPSGGAGQLKAPVALAVSAAFAMALFA